MAEKQEITENTANYRNPDGTFAKGNPGKPVGAISFAKKWEIFIDKVAKSNNLTPQDIDEQLLAVGFKKAKEGDYQFYRDLHDRLYGKPLQSIGISSDEDTKNVYNINLFSKEFQQDIEILENKLKSKLKNVQPIQEK